MAQMAQMQRSAAPSFGPVDEGNPTRIPSIVIFKPYNPELSTQEPGENIQLRSLAR